MDIEAAEPGQVQNSLRQDLSVGSHRDQIRLQSAKLLNEVFVARAFGLEKRQMRIEREFFHRRGQQFKMPSFGTVGLSDDGDDLVLGSSYERPEAGAR